MADEPQTTPVQERVRQRFADELTANHAEQEELTGQIAALQQRLDQLKADEEWLTQAQSSLPTALAEHRSGEEASSDATETPSTAPVESAPAETDAEAPQTVPAQRQKQTVKKAARAKKPAATKPAATKPGAKKPATAKETTAKKAAAKAPVNKTTAKKTAPGAEKPVSKKPAAKKPAVEQAASPKTAAATAKAASPKAATAKAPAKAAAGGPPLWELLLGVLRKTPGQPLVAREVSEQLAKDHPDRATSAQTVRNGLQTLVTKNLAEKTRQQGNVMYTAHTDTPAATATPSPAGDEPASGEAEQAAEKVPAQV
ncbi:hypothetical protein [Streptomyces flaveolus]|uniref:hypothetical protein n=1 Tax=Streptomyces flaveolus TaxID=67297 RepID=UPI003700BF37